MLYESLLSPSGRSVPHNLACVAGAERALNIDPRERMGVQVYKPATPQNRRAEVMTTREYAGGELRREEVLRVADYDLRRKAAKRDARRRLSDDRRAPAAEARRHPAETLPAPHLPAHAGSESRCQFLNVHMEILGDCMATSRSLRCVPCVVCAFGGSSSRRINLCMVLSTFLPTSSNYRPWVVCLALFLWGWQGQCSDTLELVKAFT